MNFEKCNYSELKRLKDAIEKEIAEREVLEKLADSSKTLKEELADLRSGDHILGISLSSRGHRLVDPEELSGSVDIIDFCSVESNQLRTGSKSIVISITDTKGRGFVITTGISIEDRPHCFLSLDTAKSGYDSFYTLRPKSWREDLESEYLNRLKLELISYKRDVSILDSKYHMFLEAGDRIDKVVKSL
jgi:hypothetical protein